MNKLSLTSFAVVPLLFGFAHAAQNWPIYPPGNEAGSGYIFSSEESGTGAYLGVDISDVTSDRLGALKLKEEKGVEVTMVDQDAPAGKAGLKEHDVILIMNGTAIDSGAQIKRMIHETPPGRVVTFEVSRDGQPVTIKVQLADRRKQYTWKSSNSGDYHVEIPPIPPMPAMPSYEMPEINVVMVHSSARSGLMVENLTPQLGEFFGVKNGDGVLIRSVEKGSRAEKAGFHAGDIIVKVNDEPVHDANDFTHALRSHGAGNNTVGVIRDKREQNINLTLPAPKDSGELVPEEGLTEPILDAESTEELSEAQTEIAMLEPQIILAAKQTDEVQKAISQAQCEYLREQLKTHLQPKMQELEKNKEKLKIQIERLRHEMQGDWLDI
jgi:serine protease Do